MLKRYKRVESPGAYVTMFQAAIFAWPCVLSGVHLGSGGYHLERDHLMLLG